MKKKQRRVSKILSRLGSGAVCGAMLMLGGLLFARPAMAQSASLIVTTANDSNDPNDGENSLREAITYANSQVGADIITFSRLFNAAQTIPLSTGLPNLSDNVTITGPGANLLMVTRADKNDYFLILQVNTSVSTTLSGLIFHAASVAPRGEIGPGAEETEAALSPIVLSPIVLSSATADAAMDVITLRFTGPLDAESAGDAARYTVEVNGEAQSIEAASCSGEVVTLSLPQSTLRAGDSVIVRWEKLLDRRGRIVSGQTPLMAR